MEAIGEGNVNAFVSLHDALAPTVIQVIRRVVRNQHIAEEVAQEVFLSVWQRARSFDPERASARQWISMLAHRRAVDRVRSEDASQRRAATDAHHQGRSEVTDLDDETVDHVRLSEALGALPPTQRQAIRLIYLHGLTHSEAADALDIPLGTAKGRIRAGLANLRPLLDDSVA
jgi:RNA polymerase sigma-70 factor (ECF subfamily)